MYTGIAIGILIWALMGLLATFASKGNIIPDWSAIILMLLCWTAFGGSIGYLLS